MTNSVAVSRDGVGPTDMSSKSLENKGLISHAGITRQGLFSYIDSLTEGTFV